MRNNYTSDQLVAFENSKNERQWSWSPAVQLPAVPNTVSITPSAGQHSETVA